MTNSQRIREKVSRMVKEHVASCTPGLEPGPSLATQIMFSSHREVLSRLEPNELYLAFESDHEFTDLVLNVCLWSMDNINRGECIMEILLTDSSAEITSLTPCYAQ